MEDKEKMAELVEIRAKTFSDMLAALERINEDLKDKFGYNEAEGLRNKNFARAQYLVEQAIREAKAA